MFFRDLFGNLGLGQKKINNLLSMPDGAEKLEVLISEEETLNKCKQNNEALLDYLCQKENLQTLIEFATREPADPSNKDSTYK